MTSRFAVIGSPINHSLSPKLHQAAIAFLGIDASYEKNEVGEGELASFLATTGSQYAGFSLTMPLKPEAMAVAVSVCDYSQLTGATNTLISTPAGWVGFNTDVIGARLAIDTARIASLESAILLGAGATAASFLVALSEIGFETVHVLVRDLARTDNLNRIAEKLDIEVNFSLLGSVSLEADLVVNTIPASVRFGDELLSGLQAGLLFDVIYDPWPTELARTWSERGLPVISGMNMLLWQAVMQARVFYGDSIDEQLPGEETLIAAMRASIGI